MFTFTFQAEDYFSKFTGVQGNEILVPKGVIDPADFADSPTDKRGLPIPIVYGDRSRTLSATGSPTWVADATRGIVYAGGWGLGKGDLVSAATPPTVVTPVESAGGTLMLGDVPGSTYYFCVTAIDASNAESNPFPFLPSAGVPCTITASSRKITVTWSGATGATKYRCYLGMAYFGVRWQQFIETAGTSAVFDAQPPFPGTLTSPTNVSTGASNAIVTDIDVYAVSAVMADGETALSAEATYVSEFGVHRPSFLSWTPVAGATAYRIYKRHPVGSYLWRFEIPAGTTTFQDDLTNALAAQITGKPKQDGPVPATFVGTFKDTFGVTFKAFVICQHAVKEISTIYQGGVAVDPGNYGVSFYAPGKPGFAARFGANLFTDINGKRFTMVFVLGPQGDSAADGTSPLRVALKGIESAGDGTGTLLTDLSDQYQHFLRNYVLRDSTGTAWLTTGPTWGDSPVDVDIVDAASFADTKARWAARLSGGCTGAFTVGVDDAGNLKQEAVAVWIARLNQSLDVRSGFSRKSQFIVPLWWRTVDEPPTAPEYSAQLGILRDTFKITDRPERIETKITVRYALNPALAEPWTSVTLQDTDTQNAMAGEVKPRVLDLWCTSNAAVASVIAQARLQRRRFAPREVEYESDMGALTDDLGTLIVVTHPDGYGPNGWARQPCMITRHEFDPQALKVRITAEDVYWMFDASVSATGPLPATQGAGADDLGTSVQAAFDAFYQTMQDAGAAVSVHDSGDEGMPQVQGDDPMVGMVPELTLLPDSSVEI